MISISYENKPKKSHITYYGFGLIEIYELKLKKKNFLTKPLNIFQTLLKLRKKSSGENKK